MSPSTSKRLAVAALVALVLASPLAGAWIADHPLDGFLLGASAIPTGRYIVLTQGLAEGVDMGMPGLAVLAVCSET